MDFRVHNICKNIVGFALNRNGNVAITFTLAAVPLLMAAGSAVDYAVLYQERSNLQEISDGAALAAAGELNLVSASKETVTDIAEAFVASYDPEVRVKVLLDEENQEIEVRLSKYWEPLIVHLLDDSAMPIQTSATAGNAGSNNICILALEENSATSLQLEGNSSISANECSVHSNATGQNSISLGKSAKLEAKSTCSAGGISASDKRIKPAPITDCPIYPDPLESRNFHSDTDCDFEKTVIENQKVTLHPGNYCGGLVVKDHANAILLPGRYNFVDGPLLVDEHSEISGKHVTLQLSGSKSGLKFTNSSVVQFSAMKSGPTAGILILAGDDLGSDNVIKIQSVDAKEFTGLIYSPMNKVEIGADTQEGDLCSTGGIHGPNCKHPPEFCESSFGQFSDWTAIVSSSIKINDGVNLEMNTDYESSDVPVPIGLDVSGQKAILIR